MESTNKLRILKIVLSLFLAFTLISCNENNDITYNPDNLLLGNWEFVSYNSNTTTFKRVSNFSENKGGVSFKLGDVFIERSSGFCGTPPISFHNYEGNWQQENDIINIITSYLQGDFQWEIHLLTTNKLIVKRQ